MPPPRASRHAQTVPPSGNASSPAACRCAAGSKRITFAACGRRDEGVFCMTDLRAALEPFGKLADQIHEQAPDDGLVVLAALDGGIIDTSCRVKVGDLRRAREALAALSADTGAGGDQFAWVIERGDSEVSAPKYWTGSAWSSDNLKAIRFVRRDDAERVRLFALETATPRHRVCEHGWTALASSPATGHDTGRRDALQKLSEEIDLARAWVENGHPNFALTAETWKHLSELTHAALASSPLQEAAGDK